jgi:hypothetical protein
MSADWRLSFPVTSFWAWCHRIPSNNESTTNANILGGLRQPFERLLCRVHHYQERTLPCEAMTLVRVGVPGLARDGEWLAAAHSHFTSNRSNKPPVTLYPEGIDALYAPADAHVKWLGLRTRPRHKIHANFLLLTGCTQLRGGDILQRCIRKTSQLLSIY